MQWNPNFLNLDPGEMQIGSRIKGGIKSCLIGWVLFDSEYVSKFKKKYILFNVDLDLYLKTKCT